MKRKKYAFTAEIARRVAARSGHFTDIIIYDKVLISSQLREERRQLGNFRIYFTNRLYLPPGCAVSISVLAD
jgi:hypothetical protein